MNLADIRNEVNERLEALVDPDGPVGCYRCGVGQRPDLYSSIDVALMRTIMGEDLSSLYYPNQREAWCNHLNSYACYYHEIGNDGSYVDTIGHGKLHANGQIIGALGILGGKQKYPCRLYDAFDTPENLGPWLDNEVDWIIPWSESHKFWGGVHCFSFSTRCTEDWLEAAFAWLAENVDKNTGWWKKGVTANKPFAYLGAAAHILPLYEHHQRTYPVPERLVDSVLALQQDHGLWLPTPEGPVSYMDLDALYVYSLVCRWMPEYRADDIRASVQRFSAIMQLFYQNEKERCFNSHPHQWLATIGAFGLLQRLLPEEFTDSEGKEWTDIFSDSRFYRTAEVERLEG